MQVIERLGWSGLVRVTVRRHPYPISTEDFEELVKRGLLDKVSDIVSRYEKSNLIVSAGKNMLRDVLRGTVTDGDIKYMGWGTSNAAVAAGQTALTSEVGRKLVTAQTPGATGVLTTTTYIAPADAAGLTINELGWFAGAAATGSANSGIMIARILYSKIKTNLESIQVDRIDTIS